MPPPAHNVKKKTAAIDLPFQGRGKGTSLSNWEESGLPVREEQKNRKKFRKAPEKQPPATGT